MNSCWLVILLHFLDWVQSLFYLFTNAVLDISLNLSFYLPGCFFLLFLFHLLAWFYAAHSYVEQVLSSLDKSAF